MKVIRVILAMLIILLMITSGVYAETSEDLDVVELLSSMPQEKRVEVVEDIMQMISEVDGLETLEAIYRKLAVENAEEKLNGLEGLTEEELAELISEQPLKVTETKYFVQSEQWKTLYPDMLTVLLLNSSTDDIKDAVIAFVAWDKNNLPVKIEGQFDFMGGSYVKKVNYDDINLTPGDTFGDGYGYSLAENTTITTFKAIVVSYETFDGESWRNPYFDEFCILYEGKKLLNE